MAGAGVDISSVSGKTDALVVDASNPQIDGGIPDSSSDEELKYGFQRPEMYESPLAGTVDPYDRHIFLCYKSPESWPARVEAADYDPLPCLLSDALKSRKNEIIGKTRLTICEGREGTDSSNGDILIFPEMIRYRGLTHLDVDYFVEDVLVKGVPWASGVPEVMKGSYIFVCSHGSRDKRCGVCGPVLVEKFKEEIGCRGLKDQVFVSPCSHIGGHKYAGNLIIFGRTSEGKVTGHWYGYVTPNDVSELLDKHIEKGEIIERIWRGQMGSSIDKEKKIDEQMLGERGDTANLDGTDVDKGVKESRESSLKGTTKDGGSCCQGASGFSCCRVENGDVNVDSGVNKSMNPKGLGKLSAWTETWNQSDVLITVGVIGAVASVAVAYSFYRRSS